MGLSLERRRSFDVNYDTHLVLYERYLISVTNLLNKDFTVSSEQNRS